jgi:acetolactate synthase small subunit
MQEARLRDVPEVSQISSNSTIPRPIVVIVVEGKVMVVVNEESLLKEADDVDFRGFVCFFLLA